MIGKNEMKKILAIISICFVLCLTACDKDNTASDIASENLQITSTENQTSDLTSSNESAELSEPTESSEPAESSKPAESNKPTESNNPVVVSNMTEEQVRKIVQEEIAKMEKSDINVDEITQKVLDSINTQKQFRIGEKLYNPLGDSFKLPIERQEGEYATITSVSATKLKIADITNLDDYYHNYYYRYMYEVTVTGKVDKKFANQTIKVRMQFEYYTEPYGRGNGGSTKIKNDGTFSIKYIAHSNANENTIIPNSIYID